MSDQKPEILKIRKQYHKEDLKMSGITAHFSYQ